MHIVALPVTTKTGHPNHGSRITATIDPKQMRRVLYALLVLLDLTQRPCWSLYIFVTVNRLVILASLPHSSAGDARRFKQTNEPCLSRTHPSCTSCQGMYHSGPHSWTQLARFGLGWCCTLNTPSQHEPHY